MDIRAALRTALSLGAAFVGLLLSIQAPAVWGGTGPRPVAAEMQGIVAVVYDEDDGELQAQLREMLSGIEGLPDIVVHRIALRDDEPLPQPRGGRVRPVQLALGGTGSPGIAVLYPDIGEPYRSVFHRIIEGIEDKTRTRVTSLAVGAQQSAQDLAAELRRNRVQVVIALGRNGLKAASSLDPDINVVVGGVLSVPETELRGMAVHSLAPDPALLFERLRSLMPAVRRVFVVHDPRQNAWLMRLAREAARSQNLELVVHEATDLKMAMLRYQEITAAADPRRDALWLPQDSVTVDESAVLPFVLQEAWNRSLPVFSSSLGHVKRGALFSLYPNNVELGRNLADSALGRSGGGTSGRAILPLKDVLVAVNLRTAGHLGLGIGYRQQQAFDMVFPEP
jgi:putative ABC transport system substrate-binding protein